MLFARAIPARTAVATSVAALRELARAEHAGAEDHASGEQRDERDHDQHLDQGDATGLEPRTELQGVASPPAGAAALSGMVMSSLVPFFLSGPFERTVTPSSVQFSVKGCPQGSLVVLTGIEELLLNELAHRRARRLVVRRLPLGRPGA